MTGRVVVLGSANVDLVVEVERRPGDGETLLGSDLKRFAGGKGANQAVAAARAGASTAFLGCVGDDENGRFLLANLEDAGVDTSGVRRVSQPTGTAMILVTPDGENSIVVSSGANASVDVAMAERTRAVWSAADVVVLGFEVPVATVAHTSIAAAAEGVRLVLNAAPAMPVDRSVLAVCDPLVVNETEARIVRGAPGEESDEDVAAGLLEQGARSVVVTLGARGALVADGAGVELVPAHDVRPLDTTGAGDGFVGALACELAGGADLRTAVRFAAALSALAVQREGAQASYAPRAEVEAFLAARV